MLGLSSIFEAMKLFVLVSRSGDHCNRLFQSLHFHAFCLENNYAFWNPTMLGLLDKFFPVPAKVGDIFQNYFFKYFIKILRTLSFNWIHNDPNEALGIVGLLEGWNFRCNELTVKYRSKLSRYYRINKPLSKSEVSLINSLDAYKNRGVFLIGLHIRRGDYKDFEGGRYWYLQSQYANFIDQLRQQFKHRKLLVVACSNEIPVPRCGQDISTQASWSADLRVLQLCDLLIGPPSTFTAWASYSAHIPCIHITNPDEKVVASNARVIDG